MLYYTILHTSLYLGSFCIYRLLMIIAYGLSWTLFVRESFVVDGVPWMGKMSGLSWLMGLVWRKCNSVVADRPWMEKCNFCRG